MTQIRDVHIFRSKSTGRVTQVKAFVYDNANPPRFICAVDLPTAEVSFKQTASDAGTVKIGFHGGRVTFKDSE